MNSIIMKIFLIVTTFTLFFATIKTEGKASKFSNNLDAGDLGQAEVIDVDQESIQGYGGNGGFDTQLFPTTSQWRNNARQDALLGRSEIINLLLQEIHNKKLKEQRRELDPTSSIILPPSTHGKRQIVYRQCFFNPISCF